MSKWLSVLVIGFCLLLAACSKQNNENTLIFATSAEYPPFEYISNGELSGFDIELAKLIAKELGKEAIFEDMQFSTILPALQNHQVDAAIATITVTSDRKKNMDFSDIYYFGGISAVYKENAPLTTTQALEGKKIGCQLGTTMEIWLKKHGFKQIVALDNNIQAIEALKANHVDVVIMDGEQGKIFSQKNPHLAYSIIDKSEDGYGIALAKGSPLVAQINQALANLKQKGELAKLEEKWLTGAVL